MFSALRNMGCAWVAAAVSVGGFAGLGVFTFNYAEGLSYFSTDPRACANCHIMQPQFDSWQKSSHHTVATCVDCHLPHDFFSKYLAKAENGWNHSKGFTLQDFEEPIRIKPRNAHLLEDNCLLCHESLVGHISQEPLSRGDTTCVHCHAGVGHGELFGLGGPETEQERRASETPRPEEPNR